MKNSIFVLLLSLFVLPVVVFAAAPDGSGPWADAVVSSSQANTKGGQPVSTVSPARSNPEAAVGPAENDYNDASFFSLGFGGSITLRFENGVRDGVIVIETTNVDPVYPVEKVSVEVSPDGSSWTSAGQVDQDGQVNMPENVSCVNYVRLTDVSNVGDFVEDTADAYDVDGVQAVNAELCQVPVTPTQTPSNPNPTPETRNDSKPKECTATKPGTPSITSVERTSGSTVKLTWTAVSPVTTYAISYGLSAGNYQYGVPSTGNVTSFVIGGLDPNASYFFSVRAINDCMPGDAAGDKPTGGSVLGSNTGGGDVLGASTGTLAPTGSSELYVRAILGFAAMIGSYSVVFALIKRMSDR